MLNVPEAMAEWVMIEVDLWKIGSLLGYKQGIAKFLLQPPSAVYISSGKIRKVERKGTSAPW